MRNGKYQGSNSMLKKICLFFCIIILVVSAYGCGEEATPIAEPDQPDYEGIILAIGKCVGETASVIFTAGTSLRIPMSLFDSGRTLAVHFYLLIRETGASDMAYGSAATLLISILVVNFFAYWLMRKLVARVS